MCAQSTNDKYLQGKCTVQKAKGLNHQNSFMRWVVQKRKRGIWVLGPKMMPTWLTSTFLAREWRLSGFVQVLLRLSSWNPTSSTP